MKLIHVFALYLMSVFQTSCAQNQSKLPLDNVRSEAKDTASSSGPIGVWDIEQDRKGNIWFAASNGIFRYDGESFSSISDNRILHPVFSIFEDSKGNFWFGTYGSGLYHYDGKSFQKFTTSDGLANNSVMPIYEDKAGIIWFGTVGGVSRYDGNSFQSFTTSDGLTNNDVHAIVQDKTGRIWLGTRGEITTYDGKTFDTLTDKDGKTFKNVWSIIKDKDGNIWFGADGLWRYDGTAFAQIDQTGAGVIIQDKEGYVLTSIGGSIFRYDEKSLSDKKPHVTEIKTKYEGRRNLPFGMLWANDGTIWIGSDRFSYDGKNLTDLKK